MAGAFTESTVIGTAGDTINRLDLPEAEKTAAAEQHPRGLRGQLPGRHRLRRLVPVEPRAAAAEGEPEGREPEARGAARGRRGGGPGAQSAYREWDLRAYRIDDAAWRGPDVWRTSRSPSRPTGSSSSGSAAATRSSTPTPDTVLAAGDVVAIAARRSVLLRGGTPIGVEIEDRALLDFPLVALRRRPDEPEPRRPDARGAGRAARARRRADEARPRRRGDPVRADDRRQPRRPPAAGRRDARTSSAPGRRSATSSGRRARPTSSSSASASSSAGFVGPPVGHGRRAAAQPDRERRRARSWASSSAGCARCARPSAGSRSRRSGSSTRSASPSSSASSA